MIRSSFFYIGLFSLLISIFSFFNIIYSYYFNLYLNLDSYVYSLIISLFFGFLFTFKKKNGLKISIYEKIIIVLMGYLLLPLFIATPYYLSIYNISFLDAYFEAISGFTSTGFTVFNNIKHLDESIILWRSSSQWIGGLYFLFSIILLIDIFDINLKKSLTNFLSFNSSETLKQLLKILILYSFLTIIIFIILNIFNIRFFTSLNLSMSLISSGGFLPANNLSDILNNKTQEVVLGLMMLVSYFSLFFTYNLVKIKKNINFFQEDFYLLIYLFFIILLSFLLFRTNYNFSSFFLAVASSISNIGFAVELPQKNISFFFLVLTIVGGSFFSTSSGIRLVKLYSLFKFSINELGSHAKPLNIFINKLELSDTKIETKDINKYFISVLIFILSLFILSSILTISGIDVESSFKLSILTLMNTVNSSIHGLNGFNFDELTYFTKYFLIIFMIIGRVELLTILIILKKFLFKN